MQLRFIILIVMGIYVLLGGEGADFEGHVWLGIFAIMGGLFWMWLYSRAGKS